MQEMRRRIRELELAELGRYEAWPEALRAAIDRCLDSAQPMQLAWGPCQRLFYNDAAIPLLGDGHPGALGRPAPDVWKARALAPPAELAAVPRRILLVEDDDATARAIAIVLEALGHHVTVAHDAAVALSLVRAAELDLALVDVRLPVVDGWELVRRLRARALRFPVIAVTGLGHESDRLRSLELGFEAHLVKPVDLLRLGSVIDQTLANLAE